MEKKEQTTAPAFLEDPEVVNYKRQKAKMGADFAPGPDLLPQGKIPWGQIINLKNREFNPRFSYLFRAIPEPIQVGGNIVHTAKIRTAGVHWIRKRRVVCAGAREMVLDKQPDPDRCPACEFALTEPAAAMKLSHFFLGVNISAYKKRLQDWIKENELLEDPPPEDDYPFILTLLECGEGLARQLVEIHEDRRYGEVDEDANVGVLHLVPTRLYHIRTGTGDTDVRYFAQADRQPGSPVPAFPIPVQRAVERFTVGVLCPDGSYRREPDLTFQIRPRSIAAIEEAIRKAVNTPEKKETDREHGRYGDEDAPLPGEEDSQI